MPRRELIGGHMTKIVIPAARVKQGDLVLYATSIKVKDLASESFYTVETLDPENTSNPGLLFSFGLKVLRSKELNAPG